MARTFKTALVIGASSGIGEAIVRRLTRDGTQVAAVARRKSELDRIAADCPGKVHGYAHDVKDYAATPALFDRIVQDLGSLDLVIYAAGVMHRVEESEYNFEKDRDMMEVNVIGAMAWLNPAGAYMENRREGTLVGISSVAGDRGRRGTPVYTASKAALTAYMEAMRNRLSRYGVNVVTIKPGPVATAMSAGLKLPFLISAEQCAEESVAMMKKGTVEGYTPIIWWPIMKTIQQVPSVIFRRTNI